MTKTRQVFQSIHSRESWMVVRNGKVVSTHATQGESEGAAIAAGLEAYRDGGLGQAVLHKANGEVRERHNYGKEPSAARLKRAKGQST